MNEDSLYWSNKYSEKEEKLGKAEAFLVQNMEFFQEGTSILDLACGDGRNAVFLARKKFRVLGIDFSREALKRLEKFIINEDINIGAKLIDLENIEEIEKLGKFDNVLVNHYKPSRELLNVIPKLLDEGGIFMLATFNYKQNLEKEFPRKYCLEKNELVDFDYRMDLVKHETRIDVYGHIDGYIFKRNSK